MNRRAFLRASAVAVAASALLPAGAVAVGAPADDFNTALGTFLQRHVRWNAQGTASTVDYGAVRRARSALQHLQDQTTRVTMAEFSSWPTARRQAFLANTYNVWTVALIADAPADTGSIKDLGNFFQSPWEKAFIPFLGETRSLDDIEHGLLRGAPDFDEPRIHFAVNCASIGCPALRPEAYTADRWDAQLDDQTRRFLRDRTRNRVLRRDTLRIGISSIFDWYGDDFESAGGVHGFLARYSEALDLTPAEAAVLRTGDARIEFLDYDWTLNDRPRD